jgi:hypothetical protein
VHMNTEIMNYIEIAKIAEQIRRVLPKVKIGTPRFWGVWFGKPYDGIYRVVRCDVDQEVLRLHFEEGETLSIWSPRGLVVNESTFRVRDADRVRWEWFRYGQPKVASNLRFKDFVRTAEGIVATTNVDWYDPELNPVVSELAVEIL